MFPKHLTYITIVIIQVLFATSIIVSLLKFTLKLHKQRALFAQILVYSLLLFTSCTAHMCESQYCSRILSMVQFVYWFISPSTLQLVYKKLADFHPYITRRSLHFSYHESLVIYYEQNKAKRQTESLCESAIQYSDNTTISAVQVHPLPGQCLRRNTRGDTCEAIGNAKTNCVKAIAGRRA